MHLLKFCEPRPFRFTTRQTDEMKKELAADPRPTKEKLRDLAKRLNINDIKVIKVRIKESRVSSLTDF